MIKNEFNNNYETLKKILKLLDANTWDFLENGEPLPDITIEYSGMKATIPTDFANINNSLQYGLKDLIESFEEYIDVDTPDVIEFSEIEPIYTGGNIWCFQGALSDGTYFMASDFMDSFRILNEDPRDKEEAWYADWQEEHLVKDIDDDKTAPIFVELYKWLESHKPDCGIDFQAEIIARQEEE